MVTTNVINYFLLGIAVFLFMYIVVIFNNLISLKNNVKKAWSNIDVLLKQRHDELPKLISTCQEYMKYEQSTLEKIVEARSVSMKAQQEGNMKALSNAETNLRSLLGNLFALAENYPDLKANQTFIHLQQRISAIENMISDRRELYNDTATLNNTRIEQFPDVIIAKCFGFKHYDPLEFTEERKDVNVSSLFKKS